MTKIFSDNEAKKRATERKERILNLVEKGVLTKENINRVIKAKAIPSKKEKVETETLGDFEHIIKLFEITEEQLSEIHKLKATIAQQAATIANLNKKLVAIQEILQEKPAPVEQKEASVA